MHMLTSTSTKLKGCIGPLKERWRAGSRKGLSDISHRSDPAAGAPMQSPPPWRTTEGESELIQQLCLSSPVVPSVCFQQSANTSVFVFAYVRLQVNSSVLTLLKQRLYQHTDHLGVFSSSIVEHKNPQDSINSVSERPPLRTNVHLLYYFFVCLFVLRLPQLLF